MHSHSCCCASHIAIIMPYEVFPFCIIITICSLFNCSADMDVFAGCACMCLVVVIFDMDFYKCPTTIPISKYIYDYSFNIIAYEFLLYLCAFGFIFIFHLRARIVIAQHGRVEMLQLLKYSRNYI